MADSDYEENEEEEEENDFSNVRVANVEMTEEEKYLENERLKKLEIMNRVAAETAKMDTPMSRADARLAILQRQTEIFASFMTGVTDASATEKIKKQKGTRGRNARMTEKQEDEILLNKEEVGARGMRINQQPSSIVGGTMRDYQIEGLNWLVKLYDNGINGILADEMGLGKTLQTISILAYLQEYRRVKGPHLVIVPKSTQGNWVKEFNKWCPTMRVLKFYGDKHERARMIQSDLLPIKFDVCVCSYEMVNREKSAFKKIKWKYVCIDEAHRIKNENSLLSQNVREMYSQNRLLITGTPLQNNLHELWALLNFLLPELFGSSIEFDSWFSESSLKDDREGVVKRLHTILRPFLLRRLKIDVEHSLPPKTETKLFIGMTEMQKQWYQTVISKDADALVAIGGGGKNRLQNILMQLRKVCNHPYLFEGAESGPPYFDGPHIWENSGKMILLDKLLPKLRSQGSRVLIFSQMTRVLDLLEDYLRLRGYYYCRIDGQTSGELRDKAMDDFNAEGSPLFVFLLSTRAGGLGINLYTADIVILYDSDWNPQADLQAMDRAHRIGQKKPVKVFRLVTEGTVEEKIVERAEKKLFLDAAVIQQGRLMNNTDNKMTQSEMMKMITFGAEQIFSNKGSSVTDADIDVILQRGDERTRLDNEKLQKNMQHTLGSFKFEDNPIQNFFEYDGENYTGNRPHDLSFINYMPHRKRGGGIVDEFRAPMPQIPRPKSLGIGVVHDYQFYDQQRLTVLRDKEDALFEQKKSHLALAAEAKIKMVKIRKRIAWRKSQALKSGENVYGQMEAEGGEEAEDDSKATILELEKEEEELKKQIAKVESAAAIYDLSPEEKEERQSILDSAFGSWSRTDFKKFWLAAEKYGRTNLNAICADMELQNKSKDEVIRYSSVFWSRITELEDHRKILDRIEKGEKKLERHGNIKEALNEKLARHGNQFRNLTVSYGPGVTNYSQEEDKFLIFMMAQLGFGAWEEIRTEIRKSPLFRFDWFFKSRTGAELERRCQTLIRLIEKENEHWKGGDSKRKLDDGEEKDGDSGIKPPAKKRQRRSKAEIAQDKAEKEARLIASGKSARGKTNPIRSSPVPTNVPASPTPSSTPSQSIQPNFDLAEDA